MRPSGHGDPIPGSPDAAPAGPTTRGDGIAAGTDVFAHGPAIETSGYRSLEETRRSSTPLPEALKARKLPQACG
jgi:cold shock CspA family protein